MKKCLLNKIEYPQRVCVCILIMHSLVCVFYCMRLQEQRLIFNWLVGTFIVGAIVCTLSTRWNRYETLKMDNRDLCRAVEPCWFHIEMEIMQIVNVKGLLSACLHVCEWVWCAHHWNSRNVSSIQSNICMLNLILKFLTDDDLCIPINLIEEKYRIHVVT